MQTSRLVCLMISTLPWFATFGCREPAYYQNKVDPVIYPSERAPGSLSLSVGLPLELDVGYYPSRNIFTNLYVQTSGLSSGDIADALLPLSIPSKDSFKNSVGLSGHWIKRYGTLNLSGGLGGDYGRTFGKNDSSSGYTSEKKFVEHDLRFAQAYFQGTFGWHFNSGLGFGFLYKRGRAQLDFQSGIRRGYQRMTRERPGVVTVEEVSGLKKTVLFYEVAHVLKYTKGPFEYQIQWKLGEADEDYFKTESGVTLVGTYTIPSELVKLKPASKRSKRAATP